MLAEADLLVPVPLHRMRLFKRRYNQSAIIVKALSKQTGVNAMVDALTRVRSTPPQGHLSAKERYKNVKSAFAVNPARTQTLKGKTVVLIDDVYTTGATVRECTKVLLKAGVKNCACSLSRPRGKAIIR
jgi:ComF family protein